MESASIDFGRRAKRYYNIDGTGEMYMGIMLLGFALLGFLQPRLAADSFWRTNLFGILAFMYGVLLPVLGLGFLLQRYVKRTVTWPRTGYVALGPTPQARRAAWIFPAKIGLLVGGIMGLWFGALAGLAAAHPAALSLARISYTVYWAPVFGLWGYWMARDCWWKWALVAVMQAGLLAITWRTPGGVERIMPPALLFVGSIWLLSGAGTLVSYLRHHARPAEDLT